METPSIAIDQSLLASRRRQRRWRKVFMPWLFMAPLIFFNVVVILAPSIGSMAYAFTSWSGLGPAKWVGLANFQRMVGDKVFLLALGNNIKWTLIFLTVPISMALIGASLLAPIKRFAMFYRVVYFLPYVIASIVNSAIWRNLLNPTRGIGVWLANHGIPFLKVAFLGNPHTVLYTIAFVDNWHWWGFLVVLYLAAMQAIDRELYEYGILEGASRWQEFWYITFPGIRPTLVFTVLMTVIWSFLVFDYIYILTQGGPGHASEVLATEVFKSAFQRFDVGYAAAVGLSMSFFTAVVVIAYNFLKSRGWEI
jgi:raffinose/stachyose/melibiose transport system permease protein